VRRVQAWVTVLAGALLAEAPAHAGYRSPGSNVNLSWSRCHGEGVGTQDRAFACDTNAGFEVLVASFQLDAPLAQVGGNEAVLDLISLDDPVPAWWDFENAGACRQYSPEINTAADASDVVCVDWAQGGSAGGIGAYAQSGFGYPYYMMTRRRRMTIALGVPPSALQELQANTEYFAFNLVIDHAKTVGPGACSGCSGSVCLVLQSIRVISSDLANNVFLSGGTTPGSDMVHWQGTVGDCNLVPVKNKTWGEVKALYR